MNPSKRGSLFLKLFLIYGLTFLAISIAISIPKWGENNNKEFFKDNINIYAQLLAREIGSPPDIRIAKDIHRRTQILIYVRGPGGDFYVPDIATYSGTQRFFQHHQYAMVPYGDYIYRFKTPHLGTVNSIGIWVTLGLILIVLIVSYHWVRKTFRPLEEIGQVASEVAKGNFSKKISYDGSGELRQLSDSINEMTVQLSNRFENLRQLLRAVSHEVRTPLTSMRLAIESVDDEQARQSLVEDIKQLDDLTYNLLEQERIRESPESLHLEDTNISETVLDVLKAFSDVPIVKEIDEDIHFSLDTSRLILAVRNIVKNAIFHGGEKQIHVSLERTDHGFKFMVRDFGAGMPEELLRRVGESFLRADQSRDRRSGGVGLGLSLVKSIIDAHGAQLILKNANPGLEVTIEFGKQSQKKR
ncbi:MAG: HAMP domain-containing sensor histidine kinase [Bdellovibrionales bacterium]